MNNRFLLTVAGAAATGFIGTASAELVDFSHGMDYWAVEHSWQVFNSNGSSVAGMSGGSASLNFGSSVSLNYWGNSMSYTFSMGSTDDIYGTVTGSFNLASGTYNVQMQDASGNGWLWGSYQGFLAIGSGSGTVLGSSGSFSFTVGGVPAPGALALLGLAGVAGSRRRK